MKKTAEGLTLRWIIDDRMNRADLKKLNPLQVQLQYVFQDLDLLIQALTHRSYAHEHGDPGTAHNERLEFLGDSVLGLVLSHLLYQKFPDLSEGELSRLRAGLVNEQQLKQLAQGLKLGKYLRLGRGEEVTGGRKKSSLLADALEAVLGAIYLEGGYEQASRSDRGPVSSPSGSRRNGLGSGPGFQNRFAGILPGLFEDYPYL